MVDDSEKDLHELSAVFTNNGIGCRTFVYDSFYSLPLDGVRILFIDINLNGAKSEQERNAILKDAIFRYIDENNGPFVLVLWTSNIEWISSFKSYVNRDLNVDMIKRRPYYIASIDKTEFYNPQSSLEEKVKAIFNTPIVSMLFDFEDAMSSAINRTISKILEIIPRGDSWGDNETFDSNAQKVFSSIAVQTIGYQNAKIDSDRAIKEAMIPIFADSFLHESQNIWNTHLEMLKKSTNAKEIKFPDNFDEAQLNHIFHIDDKPASKISRGAVSPLINIGDWFWHQFCCTYEDWFLKSFPTVSEEEKKESVLICVEYSAACDFSQRKPRTNKFLLGEIMPISVLKKVKKGSLAECILLLPYKFKIGEEEKIIAFNLNYSFTVMRLFIDEWIGNPLFSFKKELMDMIGNRYANHISRIGITTFR